jgi:hypothetical protein
MAAWLPTLFVIIVTAVGLTAAGSPSAARNARRSWMGSIIVSGSLAIAGTVWQVRSASDYPAALSGTTVSAQPSRREHNDATISALRQQVKALEDQVGALEAGIQVRTVNPDAAEKLAVYLKKFGSHRVIVSCIPGDIEAYQYANQLVNILKEAGWDAQGPQATKIFGDVRGLGINVYVSEDDHSDTVKILLDGFAKFNIPYQSRVTPSQAIPDSETVELFIGTKDSDSINAGTGPSGSR